MGGSRLMSERNERRMEQIGTVKLKEWKYMITVLVSPI